MFNKLREKICKLIIPNSLRIIDVGEITIEELLNERLKTLDKLPEVFSKDFLNDIIKDYDKFDKPNFLESEGKVKFVDEGGHAVQLKVPLLTIVPIPYISKDSVDLDQYLKENFGDVKRPKNIEDIQGVEVDVPKLNIVPIPTIPIKENKKKEKK